MIFISYAHRHFRMAPAWADSCRAPNAELFWRACRKPPNTPGIFRHPDTGSVGANSNTSVNEHSPSIGALSAPSLANPVQAQRLRRQNNELVARIHKPPGTMKLWLLDEAIDKMEEGRKRGHSLIQVRPALALFARSPLQWPAFASIACRCLREAFVILRASGKG